MASWLGVDIGSSSIKGGVLQPLTEKQQGEHAEFGPGQITDVCQRPFPSPVTDLPAGFFEVELPAIITGVREVLNELHQHAGCAEGVVISCQMGGVLLADLSVNPLTRYLSWRDQRVMKPLPGNGLSENLFSQLQQASLPDDLAAIGNELRAGSAVSLLYWLTRTGDLPDEDVMALNLGDYVLSQLCQSTPVTEPTMALGSLNLRTAEVHRDWFVRLGFGHVAWPEIRPVTKIAGYVQLHGSGTDGQRVPCYPAVGDHQCALLGAGLRDSELSLNISTGSQASLLSSTLTPGDYQTRPYFDGRFLNTITHLPAGRSLNAVVDLLCELSIAEGHPLQDPWSVIAAAVEQTQCTDLQLNPAFFAGAMGDRGHISNISLENLTVGHLFLAAFNGMADNYEICARRLSPQQAWNSIVVSGGLPQKLPRLRDVLAARFAAPMRFPPVIDETLQGLLQLATTIQNRLRA